MRETKPIAVVGLGAILPDAFDVQSFWKNILSGRYSIREVSDDRWRADLYYSSDRSAVDKTYSKIGAWVRGYNFDAFSLGVTIPPRVLAVMDDAQKWAIAASHQALTDFGYPKRPLDTERTAVIFGNAMAGEFHYRSTMRIHLPDYLDALTRLPDFQNLPEAVRTKLVNGMTAGIHSQIPAVTEDTMPGELGNIIAGRVANVFNLGGPNFVTDAACASSLAAVQSAMQGLNEGKFDAVLTGGVDRNMGVESFVKFSKIGALSPDGSRPYADGANGFVMGEGAVVFLMKRLEDAERDGDRIYAVVRGIGGSSDGKGKGITAPNPIGQQRAIERAWLAAGVSPASAGLIEGHGTSTKVGDVVEVGSLDAVFNSLGLKVGQVALGSVKSNIGHLKSAAGAAALLKVTLALYEKTLPPSVNFDRPNPNINFSQIPFRVNTRSQEWETRRSEARRAGISSFGFGGTNFHVVMEEYLPERLTHTEKVFQGARLDQPAEVQTVKPLRGLLFVSADTAAGLKNELAAQIEAVRGGKLPEKSFPAAAKVQKLERLAIDYSDADELIKRAEKALKALENETPNGWQALTAQGIYRGSGKPGKVAFLFPGQGSQYVNMLKDLRDEEPVLAETFREADEVMTPLLGRSLTSYIYADGSPEDLARAEDALRNTAITQPAVLTTNVALLRLIKKYGYQPDLVIGHSLGEYAALVAAGVMTFAEALEVVSARGREMSKVSMDDNGCMAAVSAPLGEVQKLLETIDGYVVLANINSPVQSVIGGATAAVDAAISACQAAGFQAVKIPVSHAFHTKIVAPASEPLRQVIARMNLQTPRLPVAANVTGKLYPGGREEVLDMLAKQVASPVQFIQGMQTLYEQGARVFVEVGPKRVLNALAMDIFKERSDVTVLATNHPRKGAVVSFSEALCGLLAAGVAPQTGQTAESAGELIKVTAEPVNAPVAEAIDGRLPLTGSVVISGAGLGLPGKQYRVFDDSNIERILRGEMRIEALPEESRRHMLDRRVTRLVKSDAGAVMVPIDDIDQTVKLAGQSGAFDLAEDFGVPAERVEATDISTQLAIAAGVEALRDAGIPLVMNYRQTSKGTLLPNRWMLPEALADETGVIFASAFPGLERMAEETGRYAEFQALNRQMEEVNRLADLIPDGQNELRGLLKARKTDLQTRLDELDYHFDRRFIFRILAMGHSQFAEYIGARGPNTYVNAACASTTHALALAEDWIRNGRCRRVVVIAGDDVTDGNLVNWIGTGLLASGATTTEGELRKAALPFDRRRNGMIMGMAAAALVVESEDAVCERGMRGFCELLATNIANSAFHGTRLDVQHVSEVMGRLVSQAENRFGLNRAEIARHLIFMSHETYTPARGGSAAAEIRALRSTFGDVANQVIIANTKGYTGHTMGVGVEDVVAVKALQYGVVPPIAHLDDGFEPDPELGDLNLSRGGEYPVRYALRLGAGFGSQVAMALFRKTAGAPERVDQTRYQRWLAAVSGYAAPELEVTQRTLRVRHAGIPAQPPAKSSWQYGQGPTRWADQDAAVDPTPQSARVEMVAAHPALVVEPPVEVVTAVDNAAVQQRVLALVSEKTGYPMEMLDMELDLEADLGIDTVKQAELFAAVRETYGIPRREDLRLSDYNTLGKVVQFVTDSVPQTAPATATIETQPPAATPTGMSDEEITATVLALVSEKTGYPVEMLDLELDLEADLGIDTVKQAELFAAVRESYGIQRREDLRLSDYNTLTKVVGFVKEMKGGLDEQAAVAVQAVPMSSEMQADAAENVAHEAVVSDDAVKERVLELVSERTGYPVEMLDLDLDLEADLGIDTVKQAELFAAVREWYGIPRREDLRLSDYNTLAKVVGFVLENRAAAEDLSAEASAPIEPEAAATESSSIARRVTVPMLRPRLELCEPTGVVLTEGKRVIVVGGTAKIADALAKKLRALQVEVMQCAETETEEKISAWAAQASIDGMYFLGAMEEEGAFRQMTWEAWRKHTENRLRALYTTTRLLPVEAFMICATATGGLNASRPAAAVNPAAGTVNGFTKSLAMERPAATIKIVDFEPGAAVTKIAARLVGEALHDPAVTEIGWEGDLRFTLNLVEVGDDPGQAAPLETGSVFLISGGAGGIIAPVVLDLARATRGRFYLLGRSALPAADDVDLRLLQSDRQVLRTSLMRRMNIEGNRATPAQVDARIAALERSAAALEMIAKVNALGGQARYLVCDVTDRQAVEEAIRKVVAEAGRVDVLIHAAGVEHSTRLERKTWEECASVFNVKAHGFFHLFKALEEQNALPQRVVLFSSVAARFGNAGQTDYAAANDLLDKLAAALPAEYPGMTVVAINWGAWAEVGMASRGHLPALMERAGIEMLHPADAASLVRRELELNQSGAVLLAGELGALAQPRRANCGLDVQKADAALRSGKPIHAMLSHVTGMDAETGVLLEVTLNPEQEPFLKDHALNGIPILPGVMGIEGFSVAAKHVASVLASEKGGFDVDELEDIQFLTPFKFYRGEARQVTWKAQVYRDRYGLTANVTLESTLVSRVRGSEVLRHFSGKVHLKPTGITMDEAVVPPPHWNGRYTLPAEDIYRVYFHGPAFQVLEGVQLDGERVLGKLQKNLPPISVGAQSMVSTPILVELCLQTAGIWEAGKTGVLALPSSIGTLKLYPRKVNGVPIFAEVVPLQLEDGSLAFKARVVDAKGHLYLEMQDYRTVPLPYNVEEQLLQPLKKLVE